MLRSKKSFISKITNSQLSTKIVCIILIVVFLMISASVSGILLVLNSSNKLLYQALAGSLTYSSQDISKKLSNIESMTSAVVSNSNIRKNLITLAEEDPDIRIKNAENSLNTLIADYYQTYKDNNISYINLYHVQLKAMRPEVLKCRIRSTKMWLKLLITTPDIHTGLQITAIPTGSFLGGNAAESTR